MDEFEEFHGRTSVKTLATLAAKAAADLRAQGYELDPVTLQGKVPKGLATSAWGRAWCLHLEKYADSLPLLPRGRSLLRHGSVLHLKIETSLIEAMVCADRVYHVTIRTSPCPAESWDTIKQLAAGCVASVAAFLQGKIPAALMTAITEPDEGLLPTPDAIRLSCDCPQWADFCEHSAAVLYAVGVRLDHRPELLFVLAGVDPAAIIASTVSAATAEPTAQALDQSDLGDLFGIDLE
ncbi:MAG: hypothetical protein FJ146_06140 [Deltaproteobacteria bacterium]|nr:hypothetical protein [Deltaproteobacteria bacterium]